ncbi:hypothetical protein F4861DRAFT_311794 [Xylaria intraflava]|nr:hypothetical protein F4861DRAFT_311794 [Xylaria intraflava]
MHEAQNATRALPISMMHASPFFFFFSSFPSCLSLPSPQSSSCDSQASLLGCFTSFPAPLRRWHGKGWHTVHAPCGKWPDRVC